MASFAAPAKSIPLLSKILEGNLSDGTETFSYTIYPNPHKQTSKTKRDLIKFFGNRIQNGEHCLGITEDIVKENINTKNFNALIYVKNDRIDDSASCALQYSDHCNSESKQLWISDLCRVKSHDDKITSPVKIIFEVVKNFSIRNGITENYLMVERDKPGTKKLLEVYGNYGFKVVVDSCSIDHIIAMKKSLIPVNNTNNLANKFSKMSIRGGGVWRSDCVSRSNGVWRQRRRRTRKNKK